MPMGHFGWAVSELGDIDNDGSPEVLVGAPFEDAVTFGDGRVYVFNGSDGSLLFSVASPLANGNGRFGLALSGTGDLNDDGTPDCVVGATQENQGNLLLVGNAYVFSGVDGSVIDTLTSPGPEYGGDFGSSVSGAGDVDGDGQDDVVVGALEEDGGASNAGRAYLFSGADGSIVRTLISPSPKANGGFGSAVSNIGDVDADLKSDVVVGAQSEDGGAFGAGRAYVLSGADGSLIHTLVSPNPSVNGGFGKSLSRLRDVDADGILDVVVGAPYEDEGFDGSGHAYVFSGLDGSLIHTLESPGPENGGTFGVSVSSLEDNDGDGVGDIVVGALREDGGNGDAGRAHIFSGASGSLLHTIVSPNPEQYGQFGNTVSGLSDVNQDGRGDVAIGTFFEDGGVMNAGRAYIFSSQAGVMVASSAGASIQPLARSDPNPFNTSTTIRFSLGDRPRLHLLVYDSMGRLVRTLVSERKPRGDHAVVWDGRDEDGRPVSSGVYLYTIETDGGGPLTGKVLLLK
jgi:FlgD Ig-like domain/FG-GAP repeat